MPLDLIIIRLHNMYFTALLFLLLLFVLRLRKYRLFLLSRKY